MNFKIGEEYRFFPKQDGMIVVFGIKEAKTVGNEQMRVFGNLKTLFTKNSFVGTVVNTWENGPVIMTSEFECLVLVNNTTVVSQLISSGEKAQ